VATRPVIGRHSARAPVPPCLRPRIAHPVRRSRTQAGERAAPSRPATRWRCSSSNASTT